MTELLGELVGVLVVLGVAAAVRALSARVETLSYPVLLVGVGVGVSLAGIDPGIGLSAELVTTVLLPTILLVGTEETKTEHFPRVLPLALLLTVVGVPVGCSRWAG